MFTGIIEEIGTVHDITKGAKYFLLTVRSSKVIKDVGIGDSIAVNGVCLTVVKMTANSFSADVSRETISCSTFGYLRIGDRLNLERALPATGRFGGHFVSGHIDGIGQIVGIHNEGIAVLYTFKPDNNLMKYFVRKGSIAIDGISLTVTNVESDKFSVSVIPQTMKETIMSKKSIGDFVNIECDIIGKYVEKLLVNESLKTGISKEFLVKNGF